MSKVTYIVRKLSFAGAVLGVSISVVLPAVAHAGFFTDFLGMFAKSEASSYIEPEVATTERIPVLRAALHTDPNPSKGGGDVIVTDDGALDASGVSEFSDAGERSNGEITTYIVREGDALSKIAEMFGVTTNTILWANDLKGAGSIKRGDTLLILPITGVRHVVKSGDTVKSIAQKYKGDVDDIISYNQLAGANDIKVGDTIVVPGGEVTLPKASVSKSKAVTGGSTVVASGFFTHPVPGAVRTQGIHGYNGVDLGAPSGTGVRAAAGGEVIISKNSGWNGGYGNYIVIKHSNGTQTLYAHLSSNAVLTGATVSQGQVIGAVGNTGRSTGNHLHFEVRGAKNPY